MDWRDAARYADCAGLEAGEWGWQFLRRNPEYRADYARFIQVWRALEADYGAPPNRDFARWRLDPRAWQQASTDSCSGEACVSEGDRVLIECAMGEKWGLRKFPLAPDSKRPQLGVELDWRDQAMQVEVLEEEALRSADSGFEIDMRFDLSRPVAPQLAQAQRLLLARRRGLEKAGRLPSRSLRQARGTLTACLRVLDAEAAGVPAPQMAAALEVDAIGPLLVLAVWLRDRGYLTLQFLES